MPRLGGNAAPRSQSYLLRASSAPYSTTVTLSKDNDEEAPTLFSSSTSSSSDLQQRSEEQQGEPVSRSATRTSSRREAGPAAGLKHLDSMDQIESGDTNEGVHSPTFSNSSNRDSNPSPSGVLPNPPPPPATSMSRRSKSVTLPLSPAPNTPNPRETRSIHSGEAVSTTSPQAKATLTPNTTRSSRGSGTKTPSLRRRMRIFPNGSSDSEDGPILPHHIMSNGSPPPLIRSRSTSSGTSRNDSGNHNYGGGGGPYQGYGYGNAANNNNNNNNGGGRSSRSRRGGGGGNLITSIPLGYVAHLLFLFTILFIMIDSKTKVDNATEQLAYYRAEGARIQAKIAEFESKAKELNLDVVQLRQENTKLEQIKKERLEKIHVHEEEETLALTMREEREKLLARDEAVRKQLTMLQRHIQNESRRDVLERFGPGPHRVEIALDFPGDKVDPKGNELPYRFHIELAPLELMPHSVHLFLEQVSRKLWDGCAFVWNPVHIMFASPHVKLPEDLDYNSVNVEEEQRRLNNARRQEFMDSGFGSVSFQEYTERYPHREFTVGLAGRPGGPNFYVNMRDNTRIHGPRYLNDEINRNIDIGQSAGLPLLLTEEEADPCFGLVVAGHDALERLRAMPTGGNAGRNGEREDGWKRSAFTEPIYIKYAKILPSKNGNNGNHNTGEQQQQKQQQKQE